MKHSRGTARLRAGIEVVPATHGFVPRQLYAIVGLFWLYVTLSNVLYAYSMRTRDWPSCACSSPRRARNPWWSSSPICCADY
jgi:hypothetical protein